MPTRFQANTPSHAHRIPPTTAVTVSTLPDHRNGTPASPAPGRLSRVAGAVGDAGRRVGAVIADAGQSAFSYLGGVQTYAITTPPPDTRHTLAPPRPLSSLTSLRSFPAVLRGTSAEPQQTRASMRRAQTASADFAGTNLAIPGPVLETPAGGVRDDLARVGRAMLCSGLRDGTAATCGALVAHGVQSALTRVISGQSAVIATTLGSLTGMAAGAFISVAATMAITDGSVWRTALTAVAAAVGALFGAAPGAIGLMTGSADLLGAAFVGQIAGAFVRDTIQYMLIDFGPRVRLIGAPTIAPPLVGVLPYMLIQVGAKAPVQASLPPMQRQAEQFSARLMSGLAYATLPSMVSESLDAASGVLCRSLMFADAATYHHDWRVQAPNPRALAFASLSRYLAGGLITSTDRILHAAGADRRTRIFLSSLVTSATELRAYFAARAAQGVASPLDEVEIWIPGAGEQLPGDFRPRGESVLSVNRWMRDRLAGTPRETGTPASSASRMATPVFRHPVDPPVFVVVTPPTPAPARASITVIEEEDVSPPVPTSAALSHAATAGPI